MAGVEVGTAYVTVLPSTRGFHQALAGDVNAASAQAGVSGGKAFAGGFNKAIPAIGAALGAAFSVQKLTQFAGQSIQAASDLAESQSKVAVVFGDSSAAINRWAETSATSLLMSRQAALEAAGTYGNLFQAFGIGQGKAQEMSTTLVQLAADLASFNNTSVDEAIQALRSGLSGETEPLKRYGIAINDTRLKAEALALGIYDGVGILDASQKAQASYSLILKDTSLAQGDVARTADGYANTMRSVTAAIDNAKATIGEGLVDGIIAASKAMGGPDGLVAQIDSIAAGIDNIATGVGVVLGAAGSSTGDGGFGGFVGPSSVEPGKQASFLDLLNNPSLWSGPMQAGVAVLSTLGYNSQVAADAQAELAAEAERAAYMQDVYSGKTQTSAVEMSAAAQAAQAYDEYLAGMTQRTLEAAGAQSSLSDELERYNKLNQVRGSGIAIREQWRALETMGDRVWVGKGKNRRQVQEEFDPTVRGGQLGTDASGDKAREWAVRLAQSYMDRADLLGGQEAEDLLGRGRKRLGRQFREWGIDNPMDYAASFLRTPATLVTQNNIDDQRLSDARDGYDESRSMGKTTVYQFNGDIKVDSDAALKQAIKEARRLASLSDNGAGPVAPVGAL
jgi:hypothetical protein